MQDTKIHHCVKRPLLCIYVTNDFTAIRKACVEEWKKKSTSLLYILLFFLFSYIEKKLPFFHFNVLKDAYISTVSMIFAS